MKKAIFTIATGEKYQAIEARTSISRRRYAEKHGWDYVVLKTIPDDFRNQLKGASEGKIAQRFKIYSPHFQTDYDLVVFMDLDTIVSDSAPCLSEIADQIPEGGFAAASTHSFDERSRLFPDWAQDYYAGIEQKYNIRLDVTDRSLCINTGLMVYRPREVKEKWRKLALDPSGMNDEHLLCLHEVQAGRCFFLPREWNMLWRYEKYRIGFLKPQRNALIKARNHAVNRSLKHFEKKLMRQALERCYLLHLASECKKSAWI